MTRIKSLERKLSFSKSKPYSGEEHGLKCEKARVLSDQQSPGVISRQLHNQGPESLHRSVEEFHYLSSEQLAKI